MPCRSKNRVALADGTVEAIGRNAFAAMLASGTASLPVRWQSHERGAEIIGRTSQLFADSYGLGFEVVVDMGSRDHRPSPHWSKVRAMMAKRSPSDSSVNRWIRNSGARAAKLNGIDCDRVTKATIDHVTITATAAYRHLTGAWIAECDLSAAPWRLQVMAAQWDAGHSAATRCGGGVDACCTICGRDAARHSHGRGKSVGCLGYTVSGHAVMCGPRGHLWKKAKR